MKQGDGVVTFLGKRELGRNTGKCLISELDFTKNGNICEQVMEEKATIPTKNQACEFSGQTRSTFLMAFSPDGAKMASTHGDHAVRITDLTTGRCCHTLKGHPRTPWCVAFHPVSDDILASGCLGGEVRIWDLRGGGSEVWRSEKNMSITSMAFHPTDQVLVFSVANEVHFWDWTQPEPFATATTAYEYEKVRWVRFDPYGYHLYTGIGNGVSVQTEEQNTEHVGSGNSTNEARANLQNQYWRILEEINQLRRERLQNEMSGGFTIRRPQPVTPASLAAQAGSVNSSNGQSATLGRPPSPVHVDALVNARIYASAVTRAQHQMGQPTSTSQDSQVSSVTSQGTGAVTSTTVLPSSAAPSQNGGSSNAPVNVGGVSAVVAPPAEEQVARSSSNSSVRSLPLGGASRFSTFLRSQLTSEAVTSHPTLTTTSSVRSLALSLASSSALPRSNTVQPVTVISTPQFNSGSNLSLSTLQMWTPSTTPSVSTGQPGPSSAFQTQGQSSSSSGSKTTTSTRVTASESVRGRFLSYLNSRANSSASQEHVHCALGQCRICQNSPMGLPRWSSGPRSVPVVPKRVSRSTSGRDGPSSSRTKQNSTRLAGLLESEVRQALDQVKARRSDISETLRDLNNLRQELDSHRCSAPTVESSDSQNPQPGTSSDVPASSSNAEFLTAELDDDLPSSQESILELSEEPAPKTVTEPGPSTSSSGDEVVNIPEPETLLSSQAEPSTGDNQPQDTAEAADSMDLDACSQESSSSGSSLGSLESLPSSQESGESGGSDTTLSLIGNYSREIERRVHDLDQRISDIQSRLQQRLENLQQQREQQQAQRLMLGSVPRCVTISERIRLRHERLRTHLQDLKRRYQNRVRNSQQAQGGGERSGEDRPQVRRSQRNLEVRRELDRQNQEEDNEGEQSTSSETSASVHQPPTGKNSRVGSPRSMRRHMSRNMSRIRANMQRDVQASREYQRSWSTLQRRNLHPHYSVNILDETVNRTDEGFQAAINRAIAGAFIVSGESSTASNIVNSSFRIQRWEFSRGNIPDISNSKECVIVPQCKLHNDGYCDISQDGRYLAVYVPNQSSVTDESILAIFSLAPETFKQCLFTKSFGPHFVSVSISPLNNYLLVGLATRRLAWVFTPRQMVAQVYKMTKPGAGEDSMEHVCDLMHPCDMDIRAPVSVNTARWLPKVGDGIVYGTNRGDLHICRPGFEQEEKRNDGDSAREPQQMRPSWVMNILGMNAPRTTNTSTQTIQRVRRTASTQTDHIESDDST